MGRRKISLEPAARLAGSEGLTEIEVSLWGPHSFETSMLAAVGDVPAEACLSTPPCRSAWYLVHQVGLSEVFVCAKRKVALRHISVRACRVLNPSSSAAAHCVISFFLAFFNVTKRSLSACVISSCPSSIPKAWGCQEDISTLLKGDIITLPRQRGRREASDTASEHQAEHADRRAWFPREAQGSRVARGAAHTDAPRLKPPARRRPRRSVVAGESHRWSGLRRPPAAACVGVIPGVTAIQYSVIRGGHITETPDLFEFKFGF